MARGFMGEDIGLIAEDRCTHVVVAPEGIDVALCGGGTITRRLPGGFQPGDRLNCGKCERLRLQPTD